MTDKLYAWYSAEQYKRTGTIYVYTDLNGNTINTTCVSDSNTFPFHNYESSIFNDHKLLGECSGYIKTLHCKKLDRMVTEHLVA